LNGLHDENAIQARGQERFAPNRSSRQK
jgi:hypothetical protein